MVTVSAPGKVHLIGEHAVVYGKPAIIAAIGKRTTVKAEKHEKARYKDNRFNVDAEWTIEEVKKAADETRALWNKCNEEKKFSPLFEHVKANGYENYRKSALGILLQNIGIDSGVSVEINGDVPIGSGLGSSASLHGALAKGVAAAHSKELTTEEANEHAYNLEQIMHGTPSGGDNSACCYGGLVWFRKAQPKNEIASLREEIPHKLENFVLVNVGTPEKTTGELVQQVRDLDENFRNERMDNIEKLTNELRGVLRDKNYGRMKEIINETQKNLADVTISTPEIDKLCEAVKAIGGAAKLSGAGGGGNVLCWHEDVDKLKETIRSVGYEPMETELSVEGVRMEE